MLVESKQANTKTIKLVSGGTITLDASNLFATSKYDRQLVLNMLDRIEEYERLNPPAEIPSAPLAATPEEAFEGRKP